MVAQRLGFAEDEALTLGKAVAGLNAQSKGRRLGIFKPHEEKAKEARAKGLEDFGATMASPRISGKMPWPGHVPG